MDYFKKLLYAFFCIFLHMFIIYIYIYIQIYLSIFFHSPFMFAVLEIFAYHIIDMQ